jgi:hypothetical protein
MARARGWRPEPSVFRDDAADVTSPISHVLAPFVQPGPGRTRTWSFASGRYAARGAARGSSYAVTATAGTATAATIVGTPRGPSSAGELVRSTWPRRSWRRASSVLQRRRRAASADGVACLRATAVSPEVMDQGLSAELARCWNRSHGRHGACAAGVAGACASGLRDEDGRWSWSFTGSR